MHKQCSHCTAFMPTWKELAVSLADKPVRLVILDQRSNDVPKWFGGNPPMLLLIKKDHKQTDRPIMCMTSPLKKSLCFATDLTAIQ